MGPFVILCSHWSKCLPPSTVWEEEGQRDEVFPRDTQPLVVGLSSAPPVFPGDSPLRVQVAGRRIHGDMGTQHTGLHGALLQEPRLLFRAFRAGERNGPAGPFLAPFAAPS